jgi:phosphoenolpyruvate synthase/pyruvate phosphate dikinase
MKKTEQKTNDRWYIARKRYVPCLWPAHTYWGWPVHLFFGRPTTGKVLSVWEKGDYVVLFDRQKTWIELGQAVADKVLKDCRNHKSFRLKGIKVSQETITFCKKFAKKSPKASINDYIDFLDEFKVRYSLIMKHNMHYWVMGAPVIEEMVKRELADYKPEEVDEIFQTMVVPIENSYSSKIEQEVKNITNVASEKGLKSKKAQKLIKELSEKYFWFPYEYIGPAIWDEPTIEKIIEDNLKEGSGVNIHNSEINGNKQGACILKYALSDKIINLFRILQTLTLMADDRKRYNAEICYFLNGIIFSNLADKLGVSRDEALYVNQDLLRIFKKDKELFLKRLTNRVEMLVEVIEDGNSLWYEGVKEGNKILESLDICLSIDQDVNEIIGQPAYKGKIVGRARVLKTSQVNNFVDGEIIVTGMTTPDFTPLIKKAGAIVTDEGGITCHAAIVAREMKKPCITGTKNATKILKDGDLIEVDADKGIVKIINKNKK